MRQWAAFFLSQLALILLHFCWPFFEEKVKFPLLGEEGLLLTDVKKNLFFITTIESDAITGQAIHHVIVPLQFFSAGEKNCFTL